MAITGLIAIAIPSLMLICGVTYIAWHYIIKPKKTIKDGLVDWYHESDNDL